MGLLTLSDYRTDLQTALGDKGIVDSRLDRWINAAYLDLAGSVNFEILDADATVPTVASTASVTAPADSLVIELVRDTTSDRLLAWIPKAEYFARSAATEGEPLNWTRHGDDIYLHPIPDAIYSLFIPYKKSPDILATDAATSIFPAIWDHAIFLLSVHHATLVLGDEQRAAAWLSRAIVYIQSRMTEDDLHSGAPGLGASLPNGLKGLTDRLQTLQGAA